MASFQSTSHVIHFILCFSMVFICPNKVFGAFDSEPLSSFQNAVGAFPFSIYPNSLGALSDPTILLINRSPFGAGSINRKFGLRSIMESLFVVGGNFRNLGLGLGLSRFGNSSYQETQISILGAKSYKELVQLGISLNMYQLSISNYGQAEAIGSKVSVRYAMGTHVETMMPLIRKTLYRNQILSF